MTTAMGSSIEICDMRGPADAGPPPHRHPWEEIYVVIEGELDVTVDGVPRVLQAGGPGRPSLNCLARWLRAVARDFTDSGCRASLADCFPSTLTARERKYVMSTPRFAPVWRVACLPGLVAGMTP